jgi:16S rRNA (cytidine1402-2'-O)-methyltransferase
MTLPAGLYVVGTPIGNLGDITRRAVEVLRDTPVLVAEDTRRARKLLAHLGFSGKRLVCVDAHASERDVEDVVRAIREGMAVALVTDAGMPSVSDPGSALVSRCRSAGLLVTVIPGPSAVTAAVTVSGLCESGFWFAGFLPRKGAKRQATLQRIAESAEAVVLFESPNRMTQTLADLAEYVPEAELCVTRELTKQYEEVRVQRVSQWALEVREWRGEVTLVLGPQQLEREPEYDPEDLDLLIGRRVAQGLSPRAIAEALAPLLVLPRRVIYQRSVQLSSGVSES